MCVAMSNLRGGGKLPGQELIFIEGSGEPERASTDTGWNPS